MTPEVSVITCSYNPRPDYLKQVVESLSSQTFEKHRWEYLLIDNASSEPLENRIDLSWHPNARHIREEKLGLTHARLRGVQEAQADVLVFVDDDNVLDPDYLEQVLQTALKHPEIGAWGGQSYPIFEQEPPVCIKRHWSHLALAEFENDRWSNQPRSPETMPSGAGLCVRRPVASHYADLHANGKRSFVMDRKGNSLISGGDNDLAACACDLGMGVGLFASLRLGHLIPSERLNEDYLLRLTEGVAYSEVLLDSFRPTQTAAISRGWQGKAADVLRFLRMDAHERRIQRARKKGQARARHDLAAASSNGNSAPN